MIVCVMDPVTTADLALAMMPLIISAFENYRVTFQPTVTFRRSQKDCLRVLKHAQDSADCL